MRLEFDGPELMTLTNALYNEKVELNRLIKTAKIGKDTTKEEVELWTKWYQEVKGLHDKISKAYWGLRIA